MAKILFSRLLSNKLRQRIILWLGEDLVRTELLKAASYTGAVGVLRDMRIDAEKKADERWTLHEFADHIAHNYYHGKDLLRQAIDAAAGEIEP